MVIVLDVVCGLLHSLFYDTPCYNTSIETLLFFHGVVLVHVFSMLLWKVFLQILHVIVLYLLEHCLETASLLTPLADAWHRGSIMVMLVHC